MPIITGINGVMRKLTNIVTGGKVVGKVYLGDKLVYNRDAPVWLVRTYKSFMYSLDGINFLPLITYSGGEDDIGQACVCDGKFLMNRGNDGNNLISMTIENVRKGIMNWGSIRVPSSSGTTACASDGDKCVVTTGRSGSYDRKIYYSLDGGKTWASKGVLTCAFRIKYIGNGKFWLGLDTGEQDNAQNKKYFYWNKNNPTSYYHIEYTLPDESQIDYHYWCSGVQYCNGYYYVAVSKGTSGQKGLYRGSMQKGSAKVSCTDMLPASGVFLSDITYIYGKYYAILVRLNDGFDNDTAYSKNLYVSNDGINFTKVNNFFPSKAINMFKANGKLSVYGMTFIGQIDENQQLNYTSISDNEYQTGQLVCNKFHKM